MHFVDQAVIFVYSGGGGKGAVSFRHEKYVEFGGPDGGNGGQGGNIILRGSPHLTTLYDFKLQPHQKAARGKHGKGKQMHGAKGDDQVIVVPFGTIVYDDESNSKLIEIIDEKEVVLLRGGRGGKGNTHFKNSRNKAPRFAQDGEEGEEKRIRLDLKLIADIGLIGLPNAGKSTLISALSNAKPKIADYPFTTLQPNLGVIKTKSYKSVVIADIPGIIKGAAQGLGLGHQFLKHIERTQFLFFLIDTDDMHLDQVIECYHNLLFELEAYSPALINKKRLIILTKIDSLTRRSELKIIINQLEKAEERVLAISVFSKEGIENLLEQIETLIL